MTRIDIIRMAKESGMAGLATTIVCEFSELERFADLVAASENEACAKVCETTPWTTDIDWWRQAIKREVSERSAHECAKAIRARSQA